MAYYWTAYAGGAPARALELPGPRGRSAGLDRRRGPRPAARRRGASTPRRCGDAGVETQLVVYEDMTHSFLRWGGVVDRAHELIAWLAAALR